MPERTYICIDLKSFYASVECVERGLDPFTTKLVVADPTRTEKTICLAISPALKAMGVKNRCRVFEIPKDIEYIMAPPRMRLYIEYSADIYEVYLKYIAKEDIHVYSIDEVFMDVTDYLTMYQMSAYELGKKIMEDVCQTTGITATCGIGTNMYLAKIALDITAKHVEDHIGELDEESYKRTLWNHKPLTDFWRVGRGTVKRLERYGITTMEHIAKADEELLYRMFGIDAELLIDHAWGRESTTISDIKNYHSTTNSLTSGQVLGCDSSTEEGKIQVKEMVDLLCLELVDRGCVTQSVTLVLSYSKYAGVEPSKGSLRLEDATSSSKILMAETANLYDRIVALNMPIHKISLSFNQIVPEEYIQYGLFVNQEELEREKKMQQAMISLKKKFGKNAVLKGLNLEEGAKTIERNQQIGGHRSGEEG